MLQYVSDSGGRLLGLASSTFYRSSILGMKSVSDFKPVISSWHNKRQVSHSITLPAEFQVDRSSFLRSTTDKAAVLRLDQNANQEREMVPEGIRAISSTS